MPTWRCPHCGTPQAESSRCWVCKRSSTSCGTCRHFRRAIAGGLGYCGLDRHRLPLRGDEIRGCWESAPEVVELPGPARPAFAGRHERPRLDFVPLDDAGAGTPAKTTVVTADAAIRPPSPATPAPPDPIFGLWGDEV